VFPGLGAFRLKTVVQAVKNRVFVHIHPIGLYPGFVKKGKKQSWTTSQIKHGVMILEEGNKITGRVRDITLISSQSVFVLQFVPGDGMGRAEGRGRRGGVLLGVKTRVYSIQAGNVTEEAFQDKALLLEQVQELTFPGCDFRSQHLPEEVEQESLGPDDQASPKGSVGDVIREGIFLSWGNLLQGSRSPGSGCLSHFAQYGSDFFLGIHNLTRFVHVYPSMGVIQDRLSFFGNFHARYLVCPYRFTEACQETIWGLPCDRFMMKTIEAGKYGDLQAHQ